jgi:outer membrane lipoprotein SlyB
MKKRYNLIWVLAATAIAFTSCQSNAGTGALVGGALGAGTGALIAGGHGALIGGAVGVVGGALVGHMLDESERNRVEDNNPRTLQHIDNGEQLTVNDIITLHKSGISDKKIMELIQKTNSKYQLSTETIHRLERAGVSDTVIHYMQSRR